MSVGPSGSMWQFWGFSGLSSENSVFYSVLHHKPTKCLFWLYLQMVPAKFLVNKTFHICELHFALRFLGFNPEAKLATFFLKVPTTYKIFDVYVCLYVCFHLGVAMPTNFDSGH